MKQYLAPQQTAKLIELGVEKPKGWYVDGVTNNINLYVNIDENPMMFNYSVGELLSFLPPIIPQGSGYYINITHDSVSWVIDYQQHGDTQYKYIVSDVELIDAIFDMILRLKEEGVI